MKKEEPVHEHEHSTPTVIHHPDEDMTVLARWLQRGMEQGPRFWILLGGVMVAVAAVAVLTSGLAAGNSASTQAWIDLVPAKTVEERLKIAESLPKTPVSDWAKLRAAYEEFNNGVADLTTPDKLVTAGPRLRQALDLFQQVAAEAPKDSSQAIAAALGIARTMEARNELPEAIRQYKFVASNWPGTPEAKQAETLAKALEDPENVQFYKELYAYKPPADATPKPPGGTGSIDFKSLIPDLSSPAMTPAPAGLDAPPPPPTSAPTTPEPVSPTPAPAPTPATPEKSEPAKPAEAPKAEAPKAESPAEPTSPAAPK